MPDLSPDDIARRSFRTTFRGFDPAEVNQFLQSIAAALEELVAERDKFASSQGNTNRDLESEFRAVGAEVAEVLEAARSAAESMRERAAADAARWRSEAVAEVEGERRRARSDAEQLRGDAWKTAETLITQTQREVAAMRAEAEKESLRLVGDAERDALRLTGSARREADDVVRQARMEADKLVTEGQRSHDQIIETARKQAEQAQERTRALEERRDELKRELDSVRAALSAVESDVDDRRTVAGLSEPAEDPTPEEPPGWEPGGTVRVVRESASTTPAVHDSGEHWVRPDTAPEVRLITPAELRARETPAPEAPSADVTDGLFDPEPEEAADSEKDAAQEDIGQPDVQEDDAQADEVPDVPQPEIEVEDVDAAVSSEPDDDADNDGTPPAPASADAAVEPQPDSGEAEAETLEAAAVATQSPDIDPSSFEELTGLFARLRSPDEKAHPTTDETEEAPPPPEPVPDDFGGSLINPWELRDRLLLPIDNRALRNLKRGLTDEQNAALEALRLDETGWLPDVAAIAGRVRADLTVLHTESFSAGHQAMLALTGDKVPRPATPTPEALEIFASDLAREVEHVLVDGRSSGEGSRELSSAVSRVFRGWRTDQAERRVRDMSLAAFHQGLASSVRLTDDPDLHWLLAGRGCARCRELAETPVDQQLPPVHSGCACTISPHAP